jgi:hypothetical protein
MTEVTMDRRQQAAAAVLTAGSALVGAVGAVVSVGRRAAEAVTERLGAGGQQDPMRWRVVTIYRPIEELQQTLPQPLADLGDAIEVRVRQGPDSKGTEVAARLSPSRITQLEDPGRALEELRSALRRAKQLCEIGWVHEANVNSTTRTTPLNAPMREALRHAGGEGRL